MPLIINTNSAATMAANNLAASSERLQRSLNRLSSGSKIVNPSDDAGGLAVSMKLSAASRRQGAAMSNIGNNLSYLQTQDGALKVAGKVLDRISELKTLAQDPTKNTSDIDNYDAEFVALQDQLSSLALEEFNGIALFGSSTMEVATTESGGGIIEIGGADLMGGSGTALFEDDFDDLSNWSPQNSSVSGNELVMGNTSNVIRSMALSGAFEVTFDFQFSSPTNVEIGFALHPNGSFEFAGIINASDVGDTATHSARLVFDGAGSVSTYVDGSGTAVDVWTGVATTINEIMLQNTYSGGETVTISDFSISTGGGTPTDISSVANASSLSGVTIDTIDSAIQQLATHRADNGAQQSRLGFASELLTVNKANLEAANSRIVDVDVAVESTQLARFNVLVQAGTAMLSQANQAPQSVLKLLG
jgi:flagellin-like hook-associated protein FlgL